MVALVAACLLACMEVIASWAQATKPWHLGKGSNKISSPLGSLQSNYLAAPPCQRPDSAQSRFRAPAEGLQASKEPFIRCGTHRLEQPKSREIGKPSPVSIIKRGSPIWCTTALCYNARALLSAGVKWPSGRKRVSSRCYGVLPKRPIKKQLAPAWAVAWKDILSLFANMLFTFMSHMARWCGE